MNAFLWALMIFQAKHFLCDFVLRPRYELRAIPYGAPRGLAHAGLHVAGSLPAIVLLAPSTPLAAAILLGEFFIAYHAAWTKERLLARAAGEETPSWVLIGAEQALHQCAYVGILALL